MSFDEDNNDILNYIIFENYNRRREDYELERHMEDNDISPETKVKLKVLGVDFQAKQNAKRHKCSEYELIGRSKNTAIIRRGGLMSLEIEMNQEVDLKNIQELTIYLEFGPNPLVSKETKAIFNFTGKKKFDQEKYDWDQRVVSEEGSKAVLEIYVPPDVPVGLWVMSCETRNRADSNDKQIYRSSDLLYILFNPWNKDDDVYMADEEKRQEYVLNDVGKKTMRTKDKKDALIRTLIQYYYTNLKITYMWKGETEGQDWVFGQFNDIVLPTCLLLLERSGISVEERGNPVTVSRFISKVVNSIKPWYNGLLVGNWSDNYDDGTSPTEWTGSIKILEQYYRTNKSVKYGQCWVFSGVTTTICRALGLPCRSVTNLISAHDTNMSLTIDIYLDENGKDVKRKELPGYKDSVWTFHVWNDVWMTRPDLHSGSEYDGWQAIDSTPQEVHDGISVCGPASLRAIHNGQTHMNYDVNFVLAEVNADIVYWQLDKDASHGFKKLSSSKKEIGQQLLTKQVGTHSSDGNHDNDKEDCTSDYKFLEGTRNERAALYTAARKTRAARFAFRLPSVSDEDLEFSLKDVKTIHLGQDFAIQVSVKNTCQSKRTVRMILIAASETYTGKTMNLIKKAEHMFDLKKGEEGVFTSPVTYNEYFDNLVAFGIVKLRAIATVKETAQTWIQEDTFQMIKPTMNIKILDDAVVKRALPVRFSFKNPLDRILRYCVLNIEGLGLTRPRRLRLDNVPSNGEMMYKVNVYPTRRGETTLMANFNSKELIDITGSTKVHVASD